MSSVALSVPLGEEAARQSTSTSPFFTETRLSGVAPRKTEPLLLIAKTVESGLRAISLLKTTEAGTLPPKVRATGPREHHLLQLAPGDRVYGLLGEREPSLPGRQCSSHSSSGAGERSLRPVLLARPSGEAPTP